MLKDKQAAALRFYWLFKLPLSLIEWPEQGSIFISQDRIRTVFQKLFEGRRHLCP